MNDKIKNNSAVYYINLADRIDRKIHIENELLIFENMVSRIDAIKDKIGSIGCAKSHILALKTFLQTTKKYCFIFEDDFQFLYQQNETIKIINNIFEHDFDMILLTYNLSDAHLTFSFDLKQYNLGNICNSRTTAGYLITQNYVGTLLNNFEDCLKKQLQGFKTAIDLSFQILQKDKSFYACVPILGTQYDNYSDIENRQTIYDTCNGCIVINFVTDMQVAEDFPFIIKQYVINKNIDMRIQENNAINDIKSLYPAIKYIFVTNALVDINKLYKLYKLFLENKLIFEPDTLKIMLSKPIIKNGMICAKKTYYQSYKINNQNNYLIYGDKKYYVSGVLLN